MLTHFPSATWPACFPLVKPFCFWLATYRLICKVLVFIFFSSGWILQTSKNKQTKNLKGLLAEGMVKDKGWKETVTQTGKTEGREVLCRSFMPFLHLLPMLTPYYYEILSFLSGVVFLRRNLPLLFLQSSSIVIDAFIFTQ